MGNKPTATAVFTASGPLVGNNEATVRKPARQRVRCSRLRRTSKKIGSKPKERRLERVLTSALSGIDISKAWFYLRTMDRLTPTTPTRSIWLAKCPGCGGSIEHLEKRQNTSLHIVSEVGSVRGSLLHRT
jgi:hypothetical protein